MLRKGVKDTVWPAPGAGTLLLSPHRVLVRSGAGAALAQRAASPGAPHALITHLTGVNCGDREAEAWKPLIFTKDGCQMGRPGTTRV